MTELETQELREADRRGREIFQALSLEEKRQWFIDMGVLSPDGQLSPRYGGPAPESPDPPKPG